MNTPSTFARVRGHVALMRPYAWLWFDVLPASTLIVLLHPEPIEPRRLAAFLLGIVLADSGVSTLNDLCDQETDRLSVEADRHTRPLVSGLVSPRAATVQVVVLLVAAPLVMAVASVPSAALFVAAILVGVAYSVPPVRLSGRPFVSQLVWPVLGTICYAVVALFTGRWLTRDAMVYLAGVGFFYAVGETLAKDIRDWDNDRIAAKRTSVVVLGTTRAAALSLTASCIGCLLLTALFWTRTMHLPARVLGTAILVLWLAHAARLVATLRRTYDKGAARQLHVGFIRVYLLTNALLLADRWLSP